MTSDDESINTDYTEDYPTIFKQYNNVRRFTEKLCEPLETEDYVVQTSFDVSPPRWHIAHVTWFFETFLLKPYLLRYHPISDDYDYLFNSYYESVGRFFPKVDRGRLSRPTVKEIYEYRRFVDENMEKLLSNIPENHKDEILKRVMIGLNHEQQHQELLLMDIKHNFYSNPLKPSYTEVKVTNDRAVGEMKWVEFDSGVAEIGHSGNGFAYDNEEPRHKVFLNSFRLSSRLVTNGEYLEFMEDGGYGEPKYWLSDGWGAKKMNKWNSPLYWEKMNGKWYIFTLGGMRPLKKSEPVSHVSFYEAYAFAQWKGKRLPREEEWEFAFSNASKNEQSNFLESGFLHPVPPIGENEGLSQGYGDVWEWTQSPYVSYPNSKPLEGALGEYNAKFMVNQVVLRGGSCVTPKSHIRATYRNFFHPDKRWVFSGIRLADDNDA